MNSWVKLLLIVGVTFLVVRTMREGWGSEGGGDLPKSMVGLVHKAKTLDRKLVVLITGSDWCPACQSMERGMLSTPEWAAFAGKEIVFQVFDYPEGGQPTSPAHVDLMKLPGFRGFPTMVVANGSGKVLDMKAGFGGGTEEYIQWIRSL